MLRDQLVWGIKNDAIHQRLLQEAKLTYTRAVEPAQGLETAAQNVKTLKTKGSEQLKTETVGCECPQGCWQDDYMPSLLQNRSPRNKMLI